MKDVSSIHKNLLIKKLIKEGINLNTDKVSPPYHFANYFDMYLMQNGRYAVFPLDNHIQKSNLAYLVNDLNQLSSIVEDYKIPVFKVQNIFFVRNKASIRTIQTYQTNKFSDVIDPLKVKDYALYKSITTRIIELPQNDEMLLSWIYYTGEHIKGNYNGRWALRKIKLDQITYFIPLIIGFNKEVWNVGVFLSPVVFQL